MTIIREKCTCNNFRSQRVRDVSTHEREARISSNDQPIIYVYIFDLTTSKLFSLGWDREKNATRYDRQFLIKNSCGDSHCNSLDNIADNGQQRAKYAEATIKDRKAIGKPREIQINTGRFSNDRLEAGNGREISFLPGRVNTYTRTIQILISRQ